MIAPTTRRSRGTVAIAAALLVIQGLAGGVGAGVLRQLGVGGVAGITAPAGTPS
jgi:hypothetical protein